MQKYASNCGMTSTNTPNSMLEEVINANFTHDEIDSAIDFLKSNKSPREDNILAEFIKACKTTMTHSIVALRFFQLWKKYSKL